MKVLICMLFFHLIDDYTLQGWLASAKSKDWWKKNCPDEKYKNDYKIALIEHSFMNSFAIHIPIFIWCCKNEIVLSLSIIMATLWHCYIDNLKANIKCFNLIQDQIMHIVFIIILWSIYYFLGA